MLKPFKLINYTMTLYKLKSDQMTANLILLEFDLNVDGSEGNHIK